VHFLRLLCTYVAGEVWRAAGTGLRWAICCRSQVMRYIGFTGLAVGASSSLRILKDLP
jgi:hypothetical protein